MSVKTQSLTQINGWYLDRESRRDTNADCLSIAQILQTNQENDYSIGIYIIADGLSGRATGKRASRLAVRVARQVILQQFQTHEKPSDACQIWLQAAVHMAHSMVRITNTAYPQNQLSATLVVAIVVDNWIHVSNVGDSRAYLISDNNMRLISQDHTLAAPLIEAGLRSEAQASNSPQRKLSQAIGIEEEIYPSMVSELVYGGDYLLLCSYGLYSQIDEERICEIVKAASSPHMACRQLTQAASDAGGEDTISVILVQMQDC